MANASFSRTSRRALLTALLPLLAAAPGCDGRIGKCYVVEGTVYVEGKPLVGKSGFVTFRPDASKGNQGEFAAVGPLNPDGTYTLSTQSKDGAPAGWYRVTVTAVDEKDGAGAARSQTEAAIVGRPSGASSLRPGDDDGPIG